MTQDPFQAEVGPERAQQRYMRQVQSQPKAQIQVNSQSQRKVASQGLMMPTQPSYSALVGHQDPSNL